MRKSIRKAIAIIFVLTLSISLMGFAGEEAAAASDNEINIYYFLRNQMGLNNAAACGIVANIYKESTFNPNCYGDNGTSYGICQWHKSRLDKMVEYCAKNGYDYHSLTGQLYYLKYELETSYPNTLAGIRAVENTAEGAYEAGYSFCYNFERPANKAVKSVQRGNLAKEYWEDYGIIANTTPQTLNKLGSISSKDGFTISWKGGTGNYNRNRLHIVRRLPGTVCYDWSNEKVIITSLYTLKYTFEQGELPEGEYLVWVEPWHTTLKKPGQASGFMSFEIYDEIFYQVESDIDSVIYDASKGGSVELFGWAVNTGKLPVECYVSFDWGKAEIADSYSRTDISESSQYGAYCKDAMVGFEKSYPLSDISNGEHNIVITAKSETETKIIADMTFTVINGHDHSFTKFISNNDATYLSDGTKTAKCNLCNTKQTLPDTGTMLVLGTTAEFTAAAEDTSVKLSWKAVEDAGFYRVFVYNSGWKVIVDTSARSHTVTELTPGEEYTFAVRAFGVEEKQTYWADKYVKTTVITKPSLSKVTAEISSNSAALSWDKAAGATGYRVFKFNTSLKKWDIIVRSTSGTSAVVKQLDSAKEYLLAVRPYKNTGTEIIWADSYTSLSVVTKLPTPFIKGHSSAVGRGTLAWGTVKGAAGYQLWYSEYEGYGYKKVSNYKTPSTYHYGLESGKTYYYKARAYRAYKGSYIYSDFTDVLAVKIK